MELTAAQKRRDYMREYARRRYEVKKDMILANTKRYHETHKDQIAAKEKEYYEANKEELKKRASYTNARYRAFYKQYASSHPEFQFEEKV